MEEKLVPIRYNMKKSMPHSQLVKEMRRDLNDDDERSPKDSKRTINLKEKLKPIDLKTINRQG